MLQFKFSCNGFVTNPEWECEERPSTTTLEDGRVLTVLQIPRQVHKSDLMKTLAKAIGLEESNDKHNLWVKIKNTHTGDTGIHTLIFKDYHKRETGTYLIPAQTDCIGATTNKGWFLWSLQRVMLDVTDIYTKDYVYLDNTKSPVEQRFKTHRDLVNAGGAAIMLSSRNSKYATQW